MRRVLGTIKKGLAVALTTALLLTSTPAISVSAAELDADSAIESEVSMDTEEEIEEQQVEEQDVAADEAEETQPKVSIDDLFGEVDNAGAAAAEEATVEVNFNIPSTCTIAKDGTIMGTVAHLSTLTSGTYEVSQPTKPENKTRLESQVELVVDAENGSALVSWDGNLVSGTREDALGNTVTFDGTTLSITNADALEDVEIDEEQPDDPGEVPVDATYIVNYYVDEVAEDNFLGTTTINNVHVGDIIDYNSIELNAYKPDNTDAKTFADGVVDVESSATVVVEDDTDVVNVIYTSEEVEVADTIVTVKYYKDNLTADNFLGEYQNPAKAGDEINYENIDYNHFQPAGYGDGVFQTEVSDTIVKEDGTSVVYVLYAGSQVITEVVTETVTEPVYVEVPGETVYVEVPSDPEVVTETETVYVPGPERVVYVPSDDETIDTPAPEGNPEDTPDETDSDDPDSPESTPVQTGDTAPIVMVTIVMMLSLLGAAYMMKRMKESKIQEKEE